jgi:hypothetical protein
MEFKRHPKYQDLFIKKDGSEFECQGERLQIVDHKMKNGNVMKAVRYNGSRHSVPKLILETWGEPAPEDGRYYALYKDGNRENLHPKNLYWSRSHKITEKRKFENDLKLSKLDVDQTYEAFRRHEINNESYPMIAKDLGVSDMAVFRAVQRLKRKLHPNE